MEVVKVQGDGDCLFRALAYFHSGDGGALRIDVADFLEAKALEQEGFEEAWLQEAEKLRASAWGGHNAIVAYSLMQKVRVFLHTQPSGPWAAPGALEGSFWVPWNSWAPPGFARFLKPSGPWAAGSA